MRKSIAAILVLGLVGMSAPVGLMAQAQGVQQGSIDGEALDVGGRPLPGVQVELFEAAGGQPIGVALQATVTNSRGQWSFAAVEPGEYVVRIVVNDLVAGIQVSVGAGATVAGLLIVAPSAATVDLQIGGGLSNAAKIGLVAGGIAGVIAGVIIAKDGS